MLSLHRGVKLINDCLTVAAYSTREMKHSRLQSGLGIRAGCMYLGDNLI